MLLYKVIRHVKENDKYKMLYNFGSGKNMFSNSGLELLIKIYFDIVLHKRDYNIED